MGYYAVAINVTGVRSAHNSIHDALDKAAWEYLAGRIQQIVDTTPELERLRIEVEGPIE